jgi:hypothetical protein
MVSRVLSVVHATHETKECVRIQKRAALRNTLAKKRPATQPGTGLWSDL